MSERRAQSLAILITAVLIGGFFIVRWFRENPVQGWLIVVAIVGILGFSIYRFPAFRSSLFRTAKKSADSLVQEKKVAVREPIPQHMRDRIMERARGRCENPLCTLNTRPDIHHIDFNNSNNSVRNLIALCPSCHRSAHDGVHGPSQLMNWLQSSWQTYKRKRPRYRY